ncbi:retinoid-inducible serine carboxypeptidase-like isoform X2 [Euwallacea similis]|uniref:retinoid-inducible serine carboxypeptidase-like isoform X2 n=1 Tax=Euwallacea similis TaxID=1736056 RepID=UPI00344F3D49
MRLLNLLVAGMLSLSLAKEGFGPTDQEWGYVTVREGAHIFWWLHYTTATTKSIEKPLIIWLQGGPGGSSTEYGNFEELGPIDIDLNPRNYTWVQYANVLFVDNPVGTGFSYVESNQYATTNQQIAVDFVEFLKGFYKDLPQFESVPLYIFCESYGGKMTAEIALNLQQAIDKGEIKSNFKGVGLGDSWISPVDSCLTWSPYLYSLGMLDTEQYESLNNIATNVKTLVEKGKWDDATEAWGSLEFSVQQMAGGVDFYNILTKIQTRFSTFKALYKPRDELRITAESFMNDQVAPALNLTSTWGAQSDNVFNYLRTDFMKPVTDVVERLLNETNITLAVYNGAMDLIVDTPGTIDWVDRLKFKESPFWVGTSKNAFEVEGVIEGFEKKAGNLEFYWVLRAGHMVPRDNPNAMLHILQQVTDNFQV